MSGSAKPSPPTAGSAISIKRAAWAVFAAALAVRLAYVAGWGHGPAELAGDALDYHSYAVHLLDRGVYENADGLLAWRMPGYPLFLAAVYSIFGRSVLAVQLVQSIVGAGTCVLVFLVAADWLGSGWALAAGLSAAFYYDLFSSSARLLTECPTTFLITLSLYLLGKRRAFGAGLVAGAAYLFRSEAAPFALLLAGFAFHGRPRGPRRWRAPAALLLGAALCVLPWALRNRAALGRAVLSSTAGSFNVYAWGLPKTVNERLGGLKDMYHHPKALGELEISDAYAKAARDFYHAASPGVLLRALAVNLAVFYYPFLPEYDPTFVFFLPFALWGAWLGRRDLRRQPWIAWVVYLTLLHMAVAVMGSRHRQKLAGALILLAFSAIKESRGVLGTRASRNALAAWAGLDLAVWGIAPWVRGVVLAVFKP